MRLLLLLLSIILCISISAQDVPNGDFENWVDEGAFLNPQSWETSNVDVTVGFISVTIETTTRSDDSFIGSYAARLESQSPPMGLGSSDVPGLMTLGRFVLDIASQSGDVEGGIEWNTRPSALKGHYKVFPEEGDQSFIGVGFYKVNDDTGLNDTIGEAIIEIDYEIDEWTEFTIPIEWHTDQEPDSMNIIIMSSDGRYNPVRGSTIYIDNLYFEYEDDDTAPIFDEFGPYCINETPDALPETSNNNVTGTWLPDEINTETAGVFDFVFTPGDDNIDPLTIQIEVTDSITPTFDMEHGFCKNDIVILPLTSENGVFGTWDPMSLDTETTGTYTYTFTPDENECAISVEVDIDIHENVEPEFDSFGPYDINDTPDALPLESNNGIAGTWEPEVIDTENEGSFDYTFTPNEEYHCAEQVVITVIIEDPYVTVKDIESNKQYVYPNPASNKINITGAENSKIKLYDITGKLIYSKYSGHESFTLDLSNIEAGIYFIKVNENTHKIIVK